MSEYSHSLHFLGKDVTEVERLMRQVHARGLILGSNGRTVSVLVGWDKKTELHSFGKMIDYAYGEDHGIWVRFYKDGHLDAKIVIIWDTLDIEEPEEEDRAGITEDLATILADAGFLDADRASRLASHVRAFNPEDWQDQDEFVDTLGSILEFCAFRWGKADDFAEIYAADEELREVILGELREQYPEVILVE